MYVKMKIKRDERSREMTKKHSHWQQKRRVVMTADAVDAFSRGEWRS